MELYLDLELSILLSAGKWETPTQVIHRFTCLQDMYCSVTISDVKGQTISVIVKIQYVTQCALSSKSPDRV